MNVNGPARPRGQLLNPEVPIRPSVHLGPQEGRARSRAPQLARAGKEMSFLLGTCSGDLGVERLSAHLLLFVSSLFPNYEPEVFVLRVFKNGMLG